MEIAVAALNTTGAQARTVRIRTNLFGSIAARAPQIARAIDPRVLQIAFLASFLTIGLTNRTLRLDGLQVALAIGAAIVTQSAWVRILGLRHVGLLSALITSLGLCLLVRADNPWVHPLCVTLALSAKFLLRIDGRHLFNPANLGAVIAATLLPGAWVSNGQWGQEWLLAIWFIVLGSWVALRARRIDSGLFFLGCWLLLLCGRAAWLGLEFAVVWHQACNGALLLFAFFMITDPMTSPTRTATRLVHAVTVAVLAFGWQYGLYRPNGLLFALIAMAPFVVVLERKWPGVASRWPVKIRR